MMQSDQEELHRTLTTRLKNVIMRLRLQAPNTIEQTKLDQLLDCVHPAVAFLDRLPVTLRVVITNQSRADIVLNMVGHAIISWGCMVRKEVVKNDTDERICALEGVAEVGLCKFGAYPEFPGSGIYVLRTPAENQKLLLDLEEAKTKSLDQKLAARAARFEGENGES